MLQLHKTYTGKEFNEINKSVLWKLTNIDEIHNSFVFKTGLNVDTIKFNPLGESELGGIYFCSN